MSDKGDRASSMKSAYELALERLDEQGIEPPREGGLDEAARTRILRARSQAEAKLAELEILHRDRLRKVTDPSERRKEEEEYVAARRRIAERRDREIESIRDSPHPGGNASR